MQGQFRGKPGGVDQRQETREVARVECVSLRNGAAVVGIVVHSAKHGTVSAFLTQRRERRPEVTFRHVAEERLPEVCRNSAHFFWDVGIVVRQIGVRRGGIHNAERVPGRGKIIVHFPYDGRGGVLEVNRHTAAHRRAHLVHQAAGLAEVDVFGVLPDFGNLHGVKFTLTETMVDDVANQGLIGGGGRQPGTGKHVGSHNSVEAADFIAQCADTRRHTANQCGGSVALTLHRFERVKLQRDGSARHRPAYPCPRFRRGRARADGRYGCRRFRYGPAR